MLCETNGRCVRECPEVFELAEGQALVIKTSTVPDDQEDRVRRAIEACPRQALSLDENSPR
jgi:ferredoxin